MFSPFVCFEHCVLSVYCESVLRLRAPARAARQAAVPPSTSTARPGGGGAQEAYLAGEICLPITSVLDAHAAGAQRQRGRVLVHVERSFQPGGIGDQFSGLLGAIALALADGRRLEIAPQAWSYIRLGFRLAFEAEYSGDLDWLETQRRPPMASHGDPPWPFDHCENRLVPAVCPP